MKQTTNTEWAPDWFTVGDASHMVRRSAEWLRRKIVAGEVAVTRTAGGIRLLHRSEVERIRREVAGGDA